MARRLMSALLALGLIGGLTAVNATAGGDRAAGKAGRILFEAGQAKHCPADSRCLPSYDVVRSVGPHGGKVSLVSKIRSVAEISATDDGKTAAVLSKIVAGGGANASAFTQIYLISGNGKRTEVFPKRLQGFNSTGLSISDNGKVLALTGRYTERSGSSRVWVLRRNGAGMHAVTDGTEGDDRTPALSPDGKRIIFSRTSRGNTPATRDSELFSIRTSGGAAKQLTTNAVDDVNPVYRADGNQIAFGQITRHNITGNLAVMKPSGVGQKRVISTGDTYPDPDYSPNGANLAYIGDIPKTRFDEGVYTVRVSGKNRRLVSKRFAFPGLPAWTLRP